MAKLRKQTLRLTGQVIDFFHPEQLEKPKLLSTPRSADGMAHVLREGIVNPRGRLEDEISLVGATWGPYAPAIERWEQLLGRPAPAATEPSPFKTGRFRLNARFVEWMMGLPEGWVTDIDIKRNDQLKALGNGVVPQQAYAAFENILRAYADEAELENFPRRFLCGVGQRALEDCEHE